jgi:hypothetical protein
VAPIPALDELAAALEASWDERTAYLAAVRPGNPAYGQCYPTARVVQHFLPEFEIACGDVDTGAGLETHFWNLRPSDGEHIDLSWQQFPPGARKQGFRLLGPTEKGDTPGTIARCELLLSRVQAALKAAYPA